MSTCVLACCVGGICNCPSHCECTLPVQNPAALSSCGDRKDGITVCPCKQNPLQKLSDQTQLKDASDDISPNTSSAQPQKCCSREETATKKESCCSSKNPTNSPVDISSNASSAQTKRCCSQEETETKTESCCSSKNTTKGRSDDVSSDASSAQPQKFCSQEETGTKKESCCSSKYPTKSSDDVSSNASSAQPQKCCSQEETATKKESCCSSKNPTKSPDDISSNIISAQGNKSWSQEENMGENRCSIIGKPCSSQQEGLADTSCSPEILEISPSTENVNEESASSPSGANPFSADGVQRGSSGNYQPDVINGSASSDHVATVENKHAATIVDVPDEERIQITKIRIQNVCCPKESYIADEALSKLDGVHKVRVNLIGRVVYVSHNPVLIRPTELTMALNKRHLGASIVDIGETEDVEDDLPRDLKILIALLAIQVVLLGMALAAKFSKASWYMWIAIALICLGIVPLLKKCLHAIYHRTIDLNILILLTVIGTLAIQQWMEAAAVMFVFTLANFLQQYCFFRVQKTVSSLMLSKPSEAVIAATGDCVAIEKIPVGSIIAVRQGELIPLDGVVVKGSASVDESSITGEAVPVEKSPRSHTYSGTVIQHGYLELQTTSSSTSSTMSKISDLVEEAQTNVSPTEIMINKFAKYISPLIVLLALLVFLVPLILGQSGVDAYKGETKRWGERALIVLVTACPCALLMATPIVVICSISGAARLGTLIKGGSFLETLSRLTHLAFDKTGTLTEGRFQVVDIMTVDSGEEREVLRRVAALESKSSHPLAAAVVMSFTGECIAEFSEEAEELLPDVTEFHTLEAQGISGLVEGHLVHVGNLSLLKQLGVTLTEKFQQNYDTFSAQSKTVVFVCVDGELALMISLADIIREESYVALRWLQDLGIRLTMLTGDSKTTATAVQRELNIDSVVSEMKPDDKLEWIVKIRDEPKADLGKRRFFHKKSATPVVGMVGDGVNDGPALAAADVGIAMAAAGSALAVDAAGVALMTNDVLKVPEMVSLSRYCRRLIFENILMAVLLKVVVVVIALCGYAHVWMAVLADLLGLLIVILNGLRPLRWKPPQSRKKGRAAPEFARDSTGRDKYQYESVE